MNWEAITHSVPGTSHHKSGLPCQDYGNYIIVDDILIGAVADGAGSAKYSDIGSELAVKTTLAYLQYRIQKLKDKHPDLATKTFTQNKAEEVFTTTLEKVISRLKQETEQGYFLRDLSCTLLAFIATPHWMTAMQVGDGFIVMRSPDSDYHLIFQPAKGEYANQTVFITSPTVFQELKIRVIPHPPKFIFASTDGLERLAIILANNVPLPEFFQGFERLIEQNKQKEVSKAILDFLDSEKVNSRTDDDKTVLICLHDELIDDTPSEEKYKEFQEHGEEPESNLEKDFHINLKQERGLNIRLVIILQNIIFAILLGLVFHYSYHLFDLILDMKPSQKFNSDYLINYSRLLWLIMIGLTTIFNKLTYSQLNKYINNKLYAMLIVLLSVVIGFGIGWIMYYPLVFIFSHQ